jgi:hypothetical protein
MLAMMGSELSRLDLTKSVKHSIGNEWSIVVDAAFTRQASGGDIVLHMPGRTIYCSVFHTDNASAEDAIHRMIEGRPGIPVQIFDREEPGLAGHAYLLPEEGKGTLYWGLNTWTAARGSVCCVTIYFHNFEDFNWAIGVWKSARPGRESKSRLN